MCSLNRVLAHSAIMLLVVGATPAPSMTRPSVASILDGPRAGRATETPVTLAQYVRRCAQGC